jgi:hypothetical protein
VCDFLTTGNKFTEMSTSVQAESGFVNPVLADYYRRRVILSGQKNATPAGVALVRVWARTQ